jgi:hypothetical protein
VSLGQLHDRKTVPALLRNLQDSNRLVRLRAAEALVDQHIDRVVIFQQAVAAHDQYALHAYVRALDNAGLAEKLETEIRSAPQLNPRSQQILLDVLRAGKLPAEPCVLQENSSAAAASRS